MADVVEWSLASHACGHGHEAALCVNDKSESDEMRQLLLLIVLIVMVFFVAELLFRSAPVSPPLLCPFVNASGQAKCVNNVTCQPWRDTRQITTPFLTHSASSGNSNLF